jgi:hypothetical protein
VVEAGVGGVVETLLQCVEFGAVAQGENEGEMQTLGWIERADELRATGEDFRADLVFCVGGLWMRRRAHERGRQEEQWRAGTAECGEGRKPHGLFFGRR